MPYIRSAYNIGHRTLTLQLLLLAPTYLGVLMLELLAKSRYLQLVGILLESFLGVLVLLHLSDLGGLLRVVAMAAFVRLSKSLISSTASSMGTQIRSLLKKEHNNYHKVLR